jgi:hypothetical protein
MSSSLPDYDELPHAPGHPEVKGCAWSVFGEGDNVGSSLPDGVASFT